MAFIDELDIVDNQALGEPVAAAIIEAMRILNTTMYVKADIHEELSIIATSPEGRKLRMAIHDALLKMAESVMDLNLEIVEETQEAYDGLPAPDPDTLYGIVEPNSIVAIEYDNNTGVRTGNAYKFQNLTALSRYLKENYSEDEGVPTNIQYYVRAFDDITEDTISFGLLNDDVAIKEFICHPLLRYIDNGAFQGLVTLESIQLNDGLLYIGGGAFVHCSKLERIEIPNSVTAIGQNAFQRCDSLKIIVIDKEADSIEGAPWGAPDAEIVWLR